jgi:hypothetical protein
VKNDNSSQADEDQRESRGESEGDLASTLLG